MNVNRFYPIATVIWFLCVAGCYHPVERMQPHLNLNHAKVGLIVTFSPPDQPYRPDPPYRQQPEDVEKKIAEFEQQLAKAFLQTIQLETLYNIEIVSNGKNESDYPYLLRIAVDDVQWWRGDVASIKLRVTITETRHQSLEYQALFDERPKGNENLILKIVKDFPSCLSPQTGQPVVNTFRWLDPFAPTPTAADYPSAAAVYLIDEADVNIQLKGDTLWTKLTKYGGYYTRQTRHVALKILTERGLKYAEVIIPFGDETHIEMLKARTITSEQRVIEVTPEQIFEVDLFPEYIFFSDAKAKKFTFPAVGPGAILEYWYTVVDESVALWGDFPFQKTEPALSARFSIDVPAGMEFQYGFHCPDYLPKAFHEKTRDLSAWVVRGGYREKASSKQARKTYQYELSDLPAIPIEAQMPPWDAVGAQLTFSGARFLDEA